MAQKYVRGLTPRLSSRSYEPRKVQYAPTTAVTRPSVTSKVKQTPSQRGDSIRERKLDKMRSALLAADVLESRLLAYRLKKGRYHNDAKTRALEAKIKAAKERAARNQSALDRQADRDALRERVKGAVARAKASIGSNRPVSRFPFNEPGNLVTSQIVYASGSPTTTWSNPVYRTVGFHTSVSQRLKGVSGRRISPIPWQPYTRTVQKTIQPIGEVVYPDFPPGQHDVFSGDCSIAGVGSPAAFYNLLPSWASLEDDIGTTFVGKTLDSIRGSSFDIPSTLAELSETRKFALMAVNSTAKWVNSMRTMFDALEPLLPVAVLGLIAADAWLSWKLAIKPTLRDFDDATSVLKDRQMDTYVLDVSGAKRPRAAASASASGTFGTMTRWEASRKLSRKACFTYRIDNPVAHAMNRFHMSEIVSGAYEGVPLSFLVDYFYNIGQWLHAYEGRRAFVANGTFEDIWYVSVKRTRIVSLGIAPASCAGLMDEVIYERYKGSGIPTPGRIRLTAPDFTTESGRAQWLTVAALLGTSVFSRFLKKGSSAESRSFVSPSALAQYWLNSKSVSARLQHRERAALERAISQASAPFHFNVDLPL